MFAGCYLLAFEYELKIVWVKKARVWGFSEMQRTDIFRRQNCFRSQTGQAMISWICYLMVIFPCLIGLVYLAICVSTVVLCQSRLQNVADAGAAYYSQGHYWLGSLRTDNSRNEPLLKQRTEAACRLMLKALNLPGDATVETDWQQQSGLASVSITIPGPPLPSGLKSGKITASSNSAAGAQPPYACLRTFIRVNEGENDRICAVLPALGFGKQPGGVNTSSEGFTGPGSPGQTVQLSHARIYVQDFESGGNLSRPGSGTSEVKLAGFEAMSTSTGNLYWGR